MKIAVVGAGLAGLALTWHLLEKGATQITLFDKEGVASGASKACAGLVHPYPGEMGRRSLNAKEALEATKRQLLVSEKQLGCPVADTSGLIRTLQNEAQIALFHKHEKQYGDVVFLSDKTVLLTSGMTIDVPLYLQGLWEACKKKGATLILQKILSLDELEDFDQIYLAMGAGVRFFHELSSLKLKWTKGQRVTCSRPASLKKSLLGKGYVAAIGNRCEIGSTYEKNFTTEEPTDVWKELKSKVESFFPEVHELKPLECIAGVRVASVGHYFPKALKLSDKLHILTALGSRGLLYHAYFAEKLVYGALEKATKS